MAHAFVRGGVQRVRVGSINHEVDHPGPFVDVENLFPGGAAVCALEHAALFIGGEEVAHGGDIDNVWIGRVNYNAGDMLRITQPHVLPGRTPIERFVNTVTGVGTSGTRSISRSDPDYLAVRRSDCECTDRGDVLAFEHWSEGRSVICSLPHATIAGSNVESVEVGLRGCFGNRYV